MPKPKNKASLLSASQENFNKLQDCITALSEEAQLAEFPGTSLNRNIRDVLAHLHHWHLLFLDWYKIGMKGEKPEMPAKGYSWKTTPDLNRWINQEYQKKSLKETRQALNRSYAKIQKIIQQHSEEELFEKKRYHWTGSTSLGAYLISATSSHYDWAFKLIRKANKKQSVSPK